MNTYKMKLEDSVDSMIFDLLEVPIVDKDVEGAVDNTTVDGNVFTDYLWLKKNYVQKWSIMCDDEYSQLRGFYTRQFDNASVPTYKLYTGQNLSEDFIASGKYIMVDNTTDYNAPINSFQLLGDAEQTTYSGKNLADSSTENFVPYNSTVSEANGVLKMTANAGVLARMPLALPELTGGTTYTISFEVRGVSIADGGTFVRVRETSGGGSWISSPVNIGVSSSFTTGTIVFTPSSTVSPYLWFYLSTANTNTTDVEIYVKNIQLEQGSTATSYEPYVGGTASPNPDYPQEVNVVTGEQTVKIEGKNLFDVGDSFDSWFACDTNGTRILSGDITTKITGSISNNKITINTYDSSGGYWWMGKLVTLPKNETLTAMTADGTHMRLNVVGFDSLEANTIGTVLLDWRPTSTTAQQFNTGDYKFYAVTIYPSVASGNNSGVVDRLQLELGSTATDYEAFKSVEKPVNLGKNLLNPQAIHNGSFTTITELENDNYTETGNTKYRSIKIENLPAGTYTLSLTWSQTARILRTVIDGSLVSVASNTNTYTFTTTTNGLFGLTFRNTDSSNFADSDYEAQLELGSQATPYSAYFTPIELAKIGTYQDYIFNDNGTWKIHKAVNYATVELTSTVYTLSNGLKGSVYVASDKITAGGAYCSKAYQRQGGVNTTGCFYENPINFMFVGTDSDTSATLKAKYDGGDLYYVLATPYDTEITNQALIDQLNAIQNASLYTGINNISNSSVNLAGDIDLGYALIYEKENIIIPQTSVRLTLTDGGVINVCGCRQNVQLGMRETIQ